MGSLARCDLGSQLAQNKPSDCLIFSKTAKFAELNCKLNKCGGCEAGFSHQESPITAMNVGSISNSPMLYIHFDIIFLMNGLNILIDREGCRYLLEFAVEGEFIYSPHVYYNACLQLFAIPGAFRLH